MACNSTGFLQRCGRADGGGQLGQQHWSKWSARRQPQISPRTAAGDMSPSEHSGRVRPVVPAARERAAGNVRRSHCAQPSAGRRAGGRAPARGRSRATGPRTSARSGRASRGVGQQPAPGRVGERVGRAVLQQQRQPQRRGPARAARRTGGTARAPSAERRVAVVHQRIGLVVGDDGRILADLRDVDAGRPQPSAPPGASAASTGRAALGTALLGQRRRGEHQPGSSSWWSSA